MVIDSLAANASVLAIANDPRLAELFNESNYNQGLRHAIEQEADIQDREIDRLAALPPEEAVRRLMSQGEISPTGLAQYFAMVRQAAELQRQYAQTLELPEAEYRAWLADQTAVRKTNPFVDSLLSAFENAVAKTQAMTVRNAMAAAGLAVMRDGPDALQSHPDPTTGQPFVYKKTADGFELESNFQVLDKSLKLSFK